MAPDARALRVARAVARELMAEGARAVVLTGSHARGDAHAESDIDLVAVLRRAPASGEAPRPLVRRGAFLVSCASATPESVRAAFRDPALVCSHVPGWRDAIVLADPDRIAGRLRALASRWSWQPIDAACDAWVADSVAGWAEEVHKLAGALAAREALLAATQRSVLVLHLAGVMAVHHRILYGTENAMWRLVGGAMGARWRTAQSAALSMKGESLRVSCRAALRLYALAAADADALLDARQRAVVAHACALTGRPA